MVYLVSAGAHVLDADMLADEQTLGIGYVIVAWVCQKVSCSARQEILPGDHAVERRAFEEQSLTTDVI